MTIFLIIALLAGGGTSVAAQGALPGDLLYPVKVNVNENVRGWFTVSNEAKAQWDAEKVENRLEEAEKLLAEGRLSAEAKAEIEARLEANFKSFADRRADVNANAEAQANIESNFEASLKAHEQILAAMAAKNASAQGEVNSLLAKVRVGLALATQARMNAESQVTVNAGADVKSAAEGKMNAAKNKIEEVRKFIANASVSADTTAQANIKMGLASAAYTRGEANLATGAYAQAFGSFQEAMRIAQEAKMIVSAENTLKIELNLLAPSTNSSTGTNSGTNSGAKANVNSSTNTGTSSGNSGTKVEGSSKTEVKIGL